MESQYIRDVLDGNPLGFRYFISKYKDMAYSVAFRIVRNREDAEEIVQDSFLRAFKSLHSFRKDSKFSTWFYRIVVNRALSVRKISENEYVSGIDINDLAETHAGMIETAFDAMEADERSGFINSALDKLPGEDSLLLTLFHLNENSVKEINEITGISQENIKMKLSRARKKLLAVLQNELKFELKNIL